VTTDSNQNVYIAEGFPGNLFIAGGDYTIRKVTPQGNTIIIAGTGMRGFSGDMGPALEATFGQGLGLAKLGHP
jgi:hypothetical protein